MAVVAFYAAVHLVNAYLWEVRRHAPPNHGNRTALVNADPTLHPRRREYERLLDRGFGARYVPGVRLPVQEVQNLIEIDLEAVRATVRTALGLTE